MGEAFLTMNVSTTVDTSDLTKLLPEVHPMDLEFHNLCYSVPESDGPKKILNNISGKFKAGQLTAVLGPSGAGKTTLLNLLAGYCVKIEGQTGTILINGRPRHPRRFRRFCAYIMQEALIQPRLSVLEYMLVASRLKVADLNENVRMNEIVAILQILGLESCADTRSDVLSGGQKKRLTIALELVNNPSILFLDEPTTGLDTHAGKKVMQALANLAAQGRTIVCTVHQPCPLEFRAYDNVYIVAKGNCVYSGTPARLISFLQEVGTPCPTTYSPADYIIELVHMYPDIIDTLANQVLQEQNQMKFGYTPTNSKPMPTKPIEGPSAFARLRVLLGRMLLQRWRNKRLLGMQLIHHVVSAVLCGITFYGTGNDAAEFFQNIKFCLALCVFYVYTYVMVSILYFPLEVELVQRENFNNWYGAFTYYISYTLSNIPAMIPNVMIFTIIVWLMASQPLDIDRVSYMLFMGVLACFCSEGLGMFIGSLGSSKTGCILGPAVVGPLFALSFYGIGYGDNIERFMHFLMQASFMRFLIVAAWLALFGFDRVNLECTDIYCHWKDPNIILRDLGVMDMTPWGALAGVGFYTILYRILGYIAIRWRLESNMSLTNSTMLGLAGKVIGHFRKQRTVTD